MERMGAPGIQMRGGELPLVVDFIEAYRNTENGEEYIMLPIYEGGSHIKIPSKEIIESEIDGITTRVPSLEIQYLIKEQAAGLVRTLKGCLLPDRRIKAQRDMKELKSKVDMKKVQRLREKKVGFNFSLSSSVKFIATQLYRAITN